MKTHQSHILILLLVLTLSAATRARAADPAAIAWDWQTRPPAFDPAAIPSRSPILLYFSAEWCGFCKQMDRTTLADQTVRLHVAMVAHVKLDFDQQEDLAKRFSIDGVPAFLLVNERGEEISRFVGATDPLTFINWLDAGQKRASDMAVAAQARRAELRQLAEEAASTDPAAQASVREKAFGLLGRAEPEARQFATDYLGRLAQTNPQALLDGLVNPDLAVRIAVANILRPKFGDRIDPWTAADNRRAAIEQLRKEIGENSGKPSP